MSFLVMKGKVRRFEIQWGRDTMREPYEYLLFSIPKGPPLCVEAKAFIRSLLDFPRDRPSVADIIHYPWDEGFPEKTILYGMAKWDPDGEETLRIGSLISFPRREFAEFLRWIAYHLPERSKHLRLSDEEIELLEGLRTWAAARKETP